MRSNFNVLYCLAAVLMMLPLTGCPIGGSTDATTTPAADAGSGSGGTLTASDLTGSFNSPCTAKAGSGLSFSGDAFYYQDHITFTGSTFDYGRNWYSTSTCIGGIIADSSYRGSFTVGQPISASSSLSSIQFTITYAYLRPYTATAASFLSSANCTGTWTAMTGQTVFGIACSYSTQPINGEKADNVVSKSGSTIALGGFSSNRSIPGVPENTTVSTTTRTFN